MRFSRSAPLLRSRDVSVSSWEELQSKLYEGSWQDRLRRFRSPYAFRGTSDANAFPVTTLSRLGGDYKSREQSLLRNFRKYAHRDAVHVDSLWHWMALAQHHGLPTRLLDWTFSPFVALHFATVEEVDWHKAGVIWCVDCVKIKQHLPPKLRKELKNADSDVLTIEMLDNAAATLRDFEKLSREEFIAFFEPPSLAERIINQAALFSVMSKAGGQLGIWLNWHPDVYHRIVIPARLKPEIRDKLDQANINERVLFPGLDGLCQWLTRYYGTRAAPMETDKSPFLPAESAAKSSRKSRRRTRSRI